MGPPSHAFLALTAIDPSIADVGLQANQLDLWAA
jgi:hypothetical protein